MIKSNYNGLDEITLATWIDKVLDQALLGFFVKSSFRVTWIQSLNPKAMDEKLCLANM